MSIIEKRGPALAGQRDPLSVLHDAATTPGKFCQAWLALQCSLIPGTSTGLLLLTGPGGIVTPAAQWANVAQPPDLTKFAARAMTDRNTVTAWQRQEQNAAGADNSLLLIVAQPLGPADAPFGAVGVVVRAVRGIGQADPESVARQLQAGAGWLALLGQREGARQHEAQGEQSRSALRRAGAGMDALAVLGEHASLDQSCMALVNELANRLACSRVSIGVVRNGAVRLRATSHTARLKRSSPIVERIEDAMEEAVAQSAPIVFPAIARSGTERPYLITVSHKTLVPAPGGAVMSVLLPAEGAWPAGVLTFERHAGPPFVEDDLLLAQAVGALASPVIRLQVRARRWMAGRLVDLVSAGAVKLVGPGHPGLKIAGLTTVIAVTLLSAATTTHRVGARAMLEGEVQRAAAAPFDGFVLEAPARAGDVVRAGDLLVALDDRDLVLEAKKAWAEREKLRQRNQEAAAKHDRALTAVTAAQIEQAQAALTLAEDRHARARIVAPFDGVVMSGDLSQMLGSPVERGKVLFEVAPLDQFRLAIQVDEENVRWVQPGQSGVLRLAGMPGQLFPFQVSQRAPVATVEDGRNIFKVEAALLGDAQGLRPGMEGVAKVEIGERNLLWVWLHPFVDFVRLTIWKWWP